jgi:FeS assembly SUF system regulator
MIRLSRLTDYGIVLMVHLARDGGGEPRNARHLAAETDLPVPVVSKILKFLARDGLLASQRGSKGGYALARPARDISVPEMITALEGPISLTACTAHPGHCEQESSCNVREPWQQINAAVHDALSGISLADLAAPPQPGTRIPFHSLAIQLESVGSE